MNYELPPVKTNRDQTSMKFAGPKAWKEVPLPLKEIAFRKPFSKQMKQHILSKNIVKNKDLPKDSPHPPYKVKQKTENFDDLKAIFEAEDEDTVFLGFETTYTLESLFLDSSSDELEEFHGFNVPANFHVLFEDSGNEEQFFGF